MLREYETTFIIQPEITEEGRESICAKLEGILEQSGAVRLMVDDWGKRRLAYEIQKFQKGHYLSLLFLDEGQVINELERILRLEESVLRFLTVQVADGITDPEARKAEAAEKERIQKQKREEQRLAREEEERLQQEAAAAAAAEQSEVETDSDAEISDEDVEGASDDESGEASKTPDDADEEGAEDAPETDSEDGEDE